MTDKQIQKHWQKNRVRNIKRTNQQRSTPNTKRQTKQRRNDFKIREIIRHYKPSARELFFWKEIL